jgi:phage I-like protein
MKTRIVAERILLDAMGKEPPREFRILPYGETQTSKGPMVCDGHACDDVMAAYRDQGNELGIDYEHQTFAEPVQPAPAAGWFNLEQRADGLYATNVRWTPKAQAHLRAGEYRYFSPAVDLHPETRRVQKLHNLALTNLPATKGMTPLVAAKDAPQPGAQETPTMKFLLSKLGLGEGASEAQALEVLSQREARAAEEARELLTLTGAKDRSEAMGKVAGWKQAADQVTTLNARLEAIEKDKRTAEVETLIADGKREGKLAPASEAWARETGTKDINTLKTFLATAPKLVQTDVKPLPKDGTGGAPADLSETERLVAKELGLDPKAYAEFSAKRRQERSAQVKS